MALLTSGGPSSPLLLQERGSSTGGMSDTHVVVWVMLGDEEGMWAGGGATSRQSVSIGREEIR